MLRPHLKTILIDHCGIRDLAFKTFQKSSGLNSHDEMQ